jgi:hypothetical protein
VTGLVRLATGKVRDMDAAGDDLLPVVASDADRPGDAA